MRSLVVLVTLSMILPAALSGCTNGQVSPDDVVVDSLRVELFVDLHLAQARAEVTVEPADSLRNEVFALHGLDSLQYDAILKAYAAHPVEAVALYDRATDQLSSERRDR